MPKIKLNDISMYYEIHGKGEPIIFIAGFSADHTTWQEIIDLFKNHYQVILFDNRGAGQTDAPKGPYSIEQMANDVVLLCSNLNIKHAHFVGNSMGGYILQTLAFKYPELVKSAVISNSAMMTHCCFHFYVEAQLEFIKSNTPLTALIKASCSWAFSYRFLSQPGMFDRLLKWGIENPYPFTIDGYEAQYAALDIFDSRNWISKINVPTLVLGSDQDLIFNESIVKQLANQIPKAKYHGFSDCGHLPHLEHPQVYFNVIKTFLDSIN